MTPPDAAFVICVEKGPLEYKALCLIVSLRNNWGRWSGLPIYAYSPRAGRAASPWLIDIYRKFNVTPITEDLNIEYRDYPLANKPIAMAHAEGNTSHEYLIFLDSDILCWQPPELFQLPANKSLAMTVDTTKTVASSGDGDPNDTMWMELYSVFKGRPDIFITTSLDEKRVRGWWGSGVIATRRSSGLMAQWLAGFRQALQVVDFSPSATYLREQMTASALVSAHHDAFLELPISYNYQVQNHGHFSARGTSAERSILWHYQPYFNRVFKKFTKAIDRQKDISGKINCTEQFIIRLSNSYPKMIGVDEPLLASLRNRLRVKSRLAALFR